MKAPRMHADASVEVSKLKLLAIIAIAHYNYRDEHFCIKFVTWNHRESQRVGNDQPWLLKIINAKSPSIMNGCISKALQLSSHFCSYQ